MIFFFFFLLQGLNAQSLPQAKSLVPDLTRSASQYLEQLKVESVVTDYQRCRLFQSFSNGVPVSELRECFSSRLKEGLHQGTLQFFKEGQSRLTLHFHSEEPFNRAEIMDLKFNSKLRFFSFSHYPGGQIYFKNEDDFILEVREFNYRLTLSKSLARPGLEHFVLQKQCSWCSLPSRVEVLSSLEGELPRYYSDQFPSQEVTPRHFQEGVSQIYYQNVGWYSQGMKQALEY